MSAGPERRYVATALAAVAERGARAVLADIGGHLAPGRRDLPLVAGDPSPSLAPPPGLAAPELLGTVYEAMLDGDTRRRQGAYYTPRPLAAALAGAALAGQPPSARVWDPAVGGGALLLAAARALIAAGARPADVVTSQVGGVDTDPLAVDVAVTALGALGGAVPMCVRHGDGLLPAHDAEGPWDVVIANPPFRGQLKRGTSRTRAEAGALAARFGAAAAPYADDACLFLLGAVERVRDGGVVAFVLPAPLLATRDARPAREAVGGRTSLVRLWSVPQAGFGAGVRVVLAVARNQPAEAGGAWQRGEWGVLASGADGPPLPCLRADGAVGDVARVTADFRDQYYAVAAAVREGGAIGAPVVTCGLIDPARVL
ncbi:MAG TPA: N-6 DNA methylase, partial [Acidimicrobiales bacterium]|nr:N-6 DNA methylase [Acidimicrobiales bacterium]